MKPPFTTFFFETPFIQH